jgi:predicted amidohydrolase YtcJ
MNFKIFEDVGSYSDLSQKHGAAKVIDAKGRLIVPGITDSHAVSIIAHLLLFYLSLSSRI